MKEKDVPSIVREQFEDYLYKQYETSRMAVMLREGPEALDEEDRHMAMPRSKYFERKGDDSYVREAVMLAWIGWKLCLDAQAPALEAASMWTQWVYSQDRAAAELPAGYEIMWSINKFDPLDEGSGLVSISPVRRLDNDSFEHIDYNDPNDMESPGLFARMFDSALQAAKNDHARSMN